MSQLERCQIFKFKIIFIFSVFDMSCLYGGEETRDLGHMQMSCLSYFQHLLIHLELTEE